MSLKSILVKIIPLLFSLATRAWESLSKNQKSAVTQAVQFVQLIKTHLTEAPGVVISLISSELKIPISTVTTSLTGVAIAIGHPEFSPEDTIKYYQDKANAGLGDLGWNNLWNSLAGLLAPNMVSGGIDWKSIALGVIELAYEIVFKKK